MNAGDVRNISVVGAGLMGHGIAQEFALAGFRVFLHDVNDEKLARAEENIGRNLGMLSAMGLVTGDAAGTLRSNLTLGTGLAEAVAGADVVIEAAFENLTLKQELFRGMDRAAPPHAILASNTSTLLPGALASATHRPDKVLVAHYFNPPYLLPLVELVRHDGTSDETVRVMFDLLTKAGKSPVILRKEAPGFIGNRLQAALFREALSIVEQGIASAADVDTVIKNGFGRRLAAAGVFEIWEIAGWDLVMAICENLFPSLESGSAVSRVLKEKVDRGDLGTKTGKGFYEWTPESIDALKKRIAKMLVTIAQEQQGGHGITGINHLNAGRKEIGRR
jgi:3-hydroxybutyryl-CoA dehydrogenase